MDEIRTVGPAAGFRWLWDAINIGRRGAGAIFGGAGLVLLACGLAVIAFMLFLGAGMVATFGMSPYASMVVALVLMLPVLLAMALGVVGYMRVIDAVESGRAAGATDALRGFTDFDAGLNAFLVLLVMMLVQQAIVLGLLAAFVPELRDWYLASLRGVANAAPAQAPPGFWKAYLLGLAVGVVGNGIQAIAIPQVALRGRGAAGALRDGIVGALRNLPALCVLVVTGTVLALTLLAVVVAAVFLLMMVGKLVAMWLAVIVGAVLYLALLVAMVAVGAAAMYYMWRDVAGPGPGAEAPTVAA